MKAACSFPECDRDAMARGWCNAHYAQARDGRELKPIRDRQPRECALDGCDNRAAARGWCYGHYQQVRKGKELKPLAKWSRQPKVCEVPDCGKPREVSKFCMPHKEALASLGCYA